MANLQPIREYFTRHQEAMVDSIRSLVEWESPSTDVERLNRCAGYLQRAFAGCASSAQLEEVEDRLHLCVRFDPPHPQEDQVLVLTHFDTVWPVGRIDTHPFRVDADHRAYGPGIFDMKTSLIVMQYLFQALRELHMTPRRPVTLLCTSDEEIGSGTSAALIEREARRSAYVLVLEPPLPGGKLKIARKGSQGVKLQIGGVAAHAGIEIEKGASAIEEAAHQILRLQAMTDLDAGLTVNVGIVRGGTRSNVVPDRVEMAVDLRAWTQVQMAAAVQKIQNLHPVLDGTSVQVHADPGRPPLEETATMGIFQKARTLAAELDIELRSDRTGGGSDGNLTGALGIPTLDGLGIPGAGAHADHEHIELDQLVERSLLVAALVLDADGALGG